MDDIKGLMDSVKEKKEGEKKEELAPPPSLLELLQYSQSGEFASLLDRVGRLVEVLNTPQGYQFVKKLYDAGMLTVTVLNAAGIVPAGIDIPKDPNLKYSLPNKFKVGLKEESILNPQAKTVLEGSDKMLKETMGVSVASYLKDALELIPRDSPKKVGKTIESTKQKIKTYYQERKNRVQAEVKGSTNPELVAAMAAVEGKV